MASIGHAISAVGSFALGAAVLRRGWGWKILGVIQIVSALAFIASVALPLISAISFAAPTLIGVLLQVIWSLALAILMLRWKPAATG